MSHPTLLRPQDTALVVVDIQEKLLPAIANADQVVQQTARLVRGCGELGIPILVTEQYPQGLGPTVAPIQEALDAAQTRGSAVDRFTKTTFACSGCDAFLDRLEDAGYEQLLLCGIEAHICILQTALDLVEQGHMTFVAADATGSRLAANAELALHRLRQAGVITLPMESALYEMVGDAKDSAFKAICQLIK